LSVSLTRLDTYDNEHGEIPTHLLLLQPDPQNSEHDQLFLDHLPVPREAWHYDRHDRMLTWREAFGGGHLHFAYFGQGGVGVIGTADTPISVRAAATAQFSCDVALNVGATFETSGHQVIGLHWDPDSSDWNNAHWINHRLLLSYTVTRGGPMEPASTSIRFEDQAGGQPWVPDAGAFEVSLTMGKRQELAVWDLSFQSNSEPPDASRHTLDGPDSVYPYSMQLVEDAAASQLDGVMVIDKHAPLGVLLGIRGVRQNACASGYYQIAAHLAPFGIFNGRLVIDGTPVPHTALHGDTLQWSDLPQGIQQRTGLPSEGRAIFQADGTLAKGDGGPDLHRLSASNALSAMDNHESMYPVLVARHAVIKQALRDVRPTMPGLMTMSPFTKNAKGEWSDAVQSAVTDDLGRIMHSYIPRDMWHLLFPTLQQPTLQGELSIVANSPVPGVDDPAAWYRSLATAVMTSGMAEGSDDNCRNMNGPRARQWLKSQTGSSKVYYAHSQKLFAYRWREKFPEIEMYLDDQQVNGKGYASQIDAKVTSSIKDIKVNVAQDPSDPDLKDKLISKVVEAGTYAKENQLYWAFAFFTYNTAPGILANIAQAMSTDEGSNDGTELTRLFQKNVSLLTILDPSGFFARQYTSTINIFLATNILPSMYDLADTSENVDIIKQYLRSFVDKNIKNDDKRIADATAQIQALLNDREIDKILHDSIKTLKSLSAIAQDAMSLPFVATRFTKWFSGKFPRFAKGADLIGGTLIGGIVGLSVYSLVGHFKRWDKLSDEEKAQTIVTTTQFGLQIVSAIVQRGVRISAIFNVEGMTMGQRAASIAEITASFSGTAGKLDGGLVKIGSSMARWLGETSGMAEAGEGILAGAEGGAELVGRIFGRNLEEFMATRIGPVFVLAGIGFSLYKIIEGEDGTALASDIINIVSGALMLFATAGEWAIGGVLISSEGAIATMVTVAGPLAILLALVGVALMIYEMTRKPPDPVKEFVDNYVRKAGFYVSAKASSIDYVTHYANPDQAGLIMNGFTLSAAKSVLSVDDAGAISWKDDAKGLPRSVWQVITDGLGVSQIGTVIRPNDKDLPKVVYLSLLSDHSVAFRPRSSASAKSTGNEPHVLTQTWLSIPQGNAGLTSDGEHLASLDLRLQAVFPDPKDKDTPKGYLTHTPSGIGYDERSSTTFALRLSGMAPNYMRMGDIDFKSNTTPSTQQVFGPSFGAQPSDPTTYTLSPQIPDFLTFDNKTGKLSPNGKVATTVLSQDMVISASNTLGTAQARFKLSVTQLAQHLPDAMAEWVS